MCSSVWRLVSYGRVDPPAPSTKCACASRTPAYFFRDGGGGAFVFWPALSTDGFALMSLHCGMWRSAAFWLNLRPHVGHSTRSSSSSASCGISTVRMSCPFFCAAVTARAACIAWRSCADSCFHLAFLAAADLAAVAGFLAGALPTLATYLAASVPATRCACTSSGLRFCTNTFAHTLACFASASLVNERLHDLQGSNGSALASASSGGTALNALARAAGVSSTVA
mmetsp:Transcript_3028/g.8263  ORF Transcript_3028/g.8263 Transcript_3028/m.8263 type:complete len:226 (+) Transcript_3028:412-1089(+)